MTPESLLAGEEVEATPTLQPVRDDDVNDEFSRTRCSIADDTQPTPLPGSMVPTDRARVPRVRPSAKQRQLDSMGSRVFPFPSLRRQMNFVATRLHDEEAVPTPGPTATRFIEAPKAKDDELRMYGPSPYASPSPRRHVDRAPAAAHHVPRIIQLVDKRRRLSPRREDRERALLAYAKTPEPLPTMTRYDEIMTELPLAPIKNSMQLNPLLQEVLQCPPRLMTEIALTPEPSVSRYLLQQEAKERLQRDTHKPPALLRVSQLYFPKDPEAPLREYYRMRQAELKPSGPSATTAATVLLRYADHAKAEASPTPTLVPPEKQMKPHAKPLPKLSKVEHRAAAVAVDSPSAPKQQRSADPPTLSSSAPVHRAAQQDGDGKGTHASVDNVGVTSSSSPTRYRPLYVPPNRRRLAPINAPLVRCDGSPAVTTLKSNPHVRQTAIALKEALRHLPGSHPRGGTMVDPIAQLVASIPAALRNHMPYLPASDSQLQQQKVAREKMEHFRRETERRIALRDAELDTLVLETAETLAFEKDQRYKKEHAKSLSKAAQDGAEFGL